MCLRHAREPDTLMDRLGERRDLMREVRRAPNGRAALLLVWRYTLAISEPKRRPEEIVERLLAAAGKEDEEEIVTAAEMLIQRGVERGLEQGERKLLLKQLRAKFGTLSDAAVSRVDAAGTAQIDRWGERVLTAQTLEDVLDDG